ncbi:26665_t:CDS:2, partial [Dentiscutata erythropus]
IIATSSNSSTSSKERQKQLKLQSLLYTEVVVETGETPVINTNSGSDSDDLSPLPNTEVPTITNLEFTNTQSNLISHYDKTKRHDIGRMDQTCRYCKAKFWMIKKIKIVDVPLQNFLFVVLMAKFEFRKHARGYNSALACTSFGANVDNQFLGHGILNFRIHGQVYHLIELLLPNEGYTPAFAQIYIYDTANEITNHHNSLQNMLDICNPYIQNFCQVRDIIRDNATTEISMIIHGDRNQDIRHYNALSAPDVAAIMVGDGHEVNPTNRDILLKTRDGNLQKIAEVHPSYDLLHYVLLFPKENLQDVANRTKNRITTLTAWFQENMENPIARIYAYVDFPSYYTWNPSHYKWTPRKTSATMIGRLYIVQPSEGERYYLRTLLSYVKGATSFDDLKTINDYICSSFKEACSYLGLLQDDTEWDACLLEATFVQTGHQ